MENLRLITPWSGEMFKRNIPLVGIMQVSFVLFSTF